MNLRAAKIIKLKINFGGTLLIRIVLFLVYRANDQCFIGFLIEKLTKLLINQLFQVLVTYVILYMIKTKYSNSKENNNDNWATEWKNGACHWQVTTTRVLLNYYSLHCSLDYFSLTWCSTDDKYLDPLYSWCLMQRRRRWVWAMAAQKEKNNNFF